ncbi:Endonuclease/exonuclease/phosphatase [Corchorus olitorius]|uniref:Endonuclease/exonuclease/phosphatase n=1 Tax=Corchorus olitorius TaxID=93759 RepID=A0A1R3HYY7_9ROSI|nr:Endonuclease/exonuclease/phosphatase [Corchorus olitorius]
MDDLEICLESKGAEVKEATRFMVVGKVLAEKPVNRRGVLSVLANMWYGKDAPTIREFGSNIFGFAFKSEKAMNQALDNSPWTVMGNCLSLKKWDVDKVISEIHFENVQYWVQIHDLPLEMQTEENVQRIGSRLGTVIRSDEVEWGGIIWRSFLRARVEIDTSRPLLPGFWVPRPGKDRLRVRLKYERLGDFCYACGKVGHTQKNCEANVDHGGLKRFGPWMRAAPARGEPFSNTEQSEVGVAELPQTIVPVEDDTGISPYFVSENGGSRELESYEVARVVGNQKKVERVMNELVPGSACENLKSTRSVARDQRRVGNADVVSGPVAAVSVGKCAESVTNFQGFSAGIKGDITDQLYCVREGVEIYGKGKKVVQQGLEGYVEGIVGASVLALVMRMPLKPPLSDKQKPEVNSGSFLEFGGRRALVCNIEDKENNSFPDSLYQTNNTTIMPSLNPVLDTPSSYDCENLEKQLMASSMHHVEIGLVNTFRNLDLKRCWEDGRKELFCANKKIWIECGDKGMVKVIKEDSTMEMVLEDQEIKSAELFSRRFVGRRKRVAVSSRGLCNEGGNMKEAWKIDKFRDMIESCNLIDLAFQGQRYTWIRKSEEVVIKERLDRVLVNASWLEIYPKTQIFNKPIVGSDHSPILMDSCFSERKSLREFKFELMWMENEECGSVIKEGWEAEIQGSRAYVVVQKLKKCKQALIKWSSKAFPNNKKAIDEAMGKIAEIQDKDGTVEGCKTVEVSFSLLMVKGTGAMSCATSLNLSLSR